MYKLDQIKLFSDRRVGFSKHLFVFGPPVATKQCQKVTSFIDMCRFFKVPVDVILDGSLIIDGLTYSLALKCLLNVALCFDCDLNTRLFSLGKAADVAKD